MVCHRVTSKSKPLIESRYLQACCYCLTRNKSGSADCLDFFSFHSLCSFFSLFSLSFFLCLFSCLPSSLFSSFCLVIYSSCLPVSPSVSLQHLPLLSLCLLISLSHTPACLAILSPSTSSSLVILFLCLLVSSFCLISLSGFLPVCVPSLSSSLISLSPCLIFLSVCLPVSFVSPRLLVSPSPGI